MQKRGQRVVNNKHSGNIRKHAVNDNTHLACQYNNRRVREDLRTDFFFKLGLFMERGWVIRVWMSAVLQLTVSFQFPRTRSQIWTKSSQNTSSFSISGEIDLNLWRKMLRKGSVCFQRLNRIDRQEGERAWDKNKVIASHFTSNTFT